MCMDCQGAVYKEPRTRSEKLVYASAYMCTGCDGRIRKLRTPFSFFRFAFSRHTTCPGCGIDWVKPAVKDNLPTLISNHPLSLIHQLRGAPRLNCVMCDTHYHDSRPLRPLSIVPFSEPTERQETTFRSEKLDRKKDEIIAREKRDDNEGADMVDSRSQPVSHNPVAQRRRCGLTKTKHRVRAC